MRAGTQRRAQRRSAEGLLVLVKGVTRQVTRDGRRHRLMKSLSIRVRMIEDDGERDLVIVDGVIANTDPIPGTEPDAAGWVLPGLVDVHNHLSLASPAGDDQNADVRVRASASVELALGVLAVREPGSPDDASTRLADEDGWPRVITAGRFLAPSGGYFPGLAREVTAAELPSAAEQEAHRSGGWAKIIGDYLGPGGRFVPNWPAEVLAAATARVHAISGRVAIHCTCPDAVDAAVAAGVDSIEHGWAVTDSHFAAMRERGIAWVPTLSPGGSRAACEFAAAMGFADETLAWMRMVLDAQPDAIARADRAGVTVLAGTDAGQGPHGVIVDQIQMLAACGMPTTRAIGAASWAARRYLGLPSLEPGAPADLVIYDADPRRDLDVLRRPAVIILDGQPIQTLTPIPMRY
jgi:imidazolonepropionase-like amidohydrolase